MPHLLLEVGCEELPASSIPRAVAWLEAKIREDLLKLGIEVQPGQTYGTLTDLRGAATAAGHPCPSWIQDNAVVR